MDSPSPWSNRPPLLVLVTGQACTGKTTLARARAADVGLPLIAKDDIKERLFDSLGWSDRQWSKKLGNATFELMFYLIELELKAGRDAMAEANFYPLLHKNIWKEIGQRQPFRPFVIECTADSDVLLERFIRRSESGERHPGHGDQLNYAEAEATFRQVNRPPFDLGGCYFRVDTNDFSKVDPLALANAIRAELGRGLGSP
jgi:predicted kinase